MRSDDPAEIEVGCQVWSDTHQDPRGQVGGVVVAIGVNDDGEREFTVLRSCAPSAGPDVATIPQSQLRMSETSWLTRDARLEAKNLYRWLGGLRADERRNSAAWARAALDLDEAGMGGYTPRMEARYRAELAGRLAEHR